MFRSERRITRPEGRLGEVGPAGASPTLIGGGALPRHPGSLSFSQLQGLHVRISCQRRWYREEAGSNGTCPDILHIFRPLICTLRGVTDYTLHYFNYFSFWSSRQVPVLVCTPVNLLSFHDGGQI